ncbi:MAG: hypothetical protein HOO67_04190, partial [Candidatus Peribacteraceae bacterium]|nr:hypothetical protein [Candidatus Peribacteraceae bacterium]
MVENTHPDDAQRLSEENDPDSLLRPEDNLLSDSQQDEMRSIIVDFAEELELPVDRLPPPSIIVTHKAKGAHYNGKKNFLVYSPDQFLNGEAHGEEILHYFHRFFGQKESTPSSVWESNGDEFIGFLGRKCMNQSAVLPRLHGFVTHVLDEKVEKFIETGDRNRDWLLPYEREAQRKRTENILRFVSAERPQEALFPEGIAQYTRAQAVALMRDIRQDRRALSETSENWERLLLKRARSDALRHYRGYIFASLIDHGKINNWEKLLS